LLHDDAKSIYLLFVHTVLNSLSSLIMFLIDHLSPVGFIQDVDWNKVVSKRCMYIDSLRQSRRKVNFARRLDQPSGVRGSVVWVGFVARDTRIDSFVLAVADILESADAVTFLSLHLIIDEPKRVDEPWDVTESAKNKNKKPDGVSTHSRVYGYTVTEAIS